MKIIVLVFIAIYFICTVSAKLLAETELLPVPLIFETELKATSKKQPKPKLDKRREKIVRWHADFIMECIFPDGAINQHPLRRKEVWIVPYFSHFACYGLLRAYEVLGERRYLDGVKNWLIWYKNHLNPDGTVNDYIGGWYPNYKNTHNYDSIDSYAAFYAICSWEYYRITKDKDFLISIYPAIMETYKALMSVYKADGLTYAKKDFPIKYLMDNVEVLNGLVAYAKICEVLGESQKQREIISQINKTRQAIMKKFWNGKTGFFAVEINMIDDRSFSMEKWYPDGLSNILFLIFAGDRSDPNVRDLFIRLHKKTETFKDRPKAKEGYLFVWWVLAAQHVGENKIAKEYIAKFEKEFGGLDSDKYNYYTSYVSGLLIKAMTTEYNEYNPSSFLSIDETRAPVLPAIPVDVEKKKSEMSPSPKIPEPVKIPVPEKESIYSKINPEPFLSIQSYRFQVGSHFLRIYYPSDESVTRWLGGSLDFYLNTFNKKLSLRTVNTSNVFESDRWKLSKWAKNMDFNAYISVHPRLYLSYTSAIGDGDYYPVNSYGIDAGVFPAAFKGFGGIKAGFTFSNSADGTESYTQRYGVLGFYKNFFLGEYTAIIPRSVPGDIVSFQNYISVTAGSLWNEWIVISGGYGQGGWLASDGTIVRPIYREIALTLNKMIGFSYAVSIHYKYNDQQNEGVIYQRETSGYLSFERYISTNIGLGFRFILNEVKDSQNQLTSQGHGLSFAFFTLGI